MEWPLSIRRSMHAWRDARLGGTRVEVQEARPLARIQERQEGVHGHPGR